MKPTHLVFAILLATLSTGCNAVYDKFAYQSRLAVCLNLDGDAGTILEACTQVIDDKRTKGADLEGAHISRAQAHEALGDDKSALTDYDRAVALDKQSATAYTARGAFHRVQENRDAAKRDLLRAIKLDDQLTMARYNLGSLYEDEGRLDLALEQYQRAHEAAPDDPDAYNAMCWARALQNTELDQALADCNRALALDPDFINALDSRGFVHFRAGRYAEAIADTDKAIAAEPELAESLYVRGLAKRALGRTAEGDADVAKAEQLQPGIAEQYAAYPK